MKQILFILITLYAFSSCTNNGTANTEAQQKKNVELTKQYFQYFNNHDWLQVANMYTASAQFKDPSLGVGILNRSRDQISAQYAELGKLIPDINDKVVNIYPSGSSHVIVEFVSTGTPPGRQPFEVHICSIFKYENGKITQDFTYYDNFDSQ